MGYKYVERTGTVGDIVDAMNEISSLQDEMDSNASNMEEKLSHTEKYERTREAADTLGGVSEISINDGLDDIAITYQEAMPTRKRQSVSRQKRLENAVAILSAAEDALNQYADEMDTATDDEDADVSLMEDSPADAQSARDLANEIRDVIDTVEGVEFPGMFG